MDLTIWSAPGVEAVFRINVGPVSRKFRGVFKKDEAEPGQEVVLHATDPSTERDVANFCEFLGHALLLSHQDGEQFRYHIRKAIS